MRAFGIIVLSAIVLQIASNQLEPKCFGALVSNTDCSWYPRCLEKKFQCGDKGYPLGYGYEYCQRFGHLQSYPEVREWVQKTTSCLKQKLVPYLGSQEKIGCHEVKLLAFKTHPVCYNQGGFCQLFKKLGFRRSLVFIKQLAGILSLKDFLQKAAIMQVIELGATCLKKWI